MQNFTDIPSSRTLSDSLAEILNNDKTAISCNSGTTFPTTNLQIGMLCYRSDQLKLYQLIGTNPDNWRFIMDLSSGIDAQFAAKLNAATYTAADVLAKLLTVDGAGSGLDADLLDGQHASAFAAAGHNHDAAYLGKNAKAADSELLDGFNSTAFLRAVNGVGPDANGNVAVNVDLSSRVAKSGDSMSGRLTLPSATITSTAPQIDFTDTDQGTTRYLHVNGNLMGFLTTSGGWDMYANNSGQVWTANYGWLHDRFAAKSAEAALDRINNCTQGGYVNSNLSGFRIIKSGSSLYLEASNCNCNCYCFPAGTMVRMKDGTSRPIERVSLGDALQSGVGGSAIVAALHTVKLGARKAYRVNGAVVTTGDHLFKTADGWASLEPELYASLRFNRPSTVETLGGLATINASAIAPNRVSLVTIGSKLLTADGETSVTSIEVVDLPPDETLYSFMTEGAHTFMADGFVVDGAPQENI